MAPLQDILDAPENNIPQSNHTLRVLHAIEGVVIAILILGILEKIEHTQFISGISLLYFGILLWVPLSFIIPILYESHYKRKKILHYVLAGIFGGLLSLNLLGRLEKMEHTQFIPGIDFMPIALNALALAGFVFPFFHELRRKETSSLHFIMAGLLSISLCLYFLGLNDIIRNAQLFSNINLQSYISPLFIIILATSLFFFIRKACYKGYKYHYLRYLSLLILGF